MNSSTLGQRIQHVLQQFWPEGQRQAAVALGISQASISRSIHDQRPPSFEFIQALLGQTDVDVHWLITGEKNPNALDAITHEGDCGLPVARELFAGLPEDNKNAWEEYLCPVPRRLHRPSRYWSRLNPDHPLVHDKSLKFAPTDLILLEANPAEWPANLRDRICLIKVEDAEGHSLQFGRNLTGRAIGCTTQDFALAHQVEKAPPQPPFEGREPRSIELNKVPSKPTAFPELTATISAVAVYRVGPL